MAEKPSRENDMNRASGKPDGPETTARKRGKLNIFLSYAPGTGKTLAMLEAGYRRLREGVDVVVGFANPHNDALAEDVLKKIAVLPPRVISGAGSNYQGMDLDRILARRPQLVLVDDLAHVNSPGLRHVARYLEVEELLNAGIDVYTTLDVYQLESQVDAVSFLTGVVVREKVPDWLLDTAEQFELVDLPPQVLLERYQAGGMSISPLAQPYIEKFFEPANLFSLRELAMRYVARRSNTFSRAYLKQRGIDSPTADSSRLLVCLSDSFNGSRLVRAGRRMADETRSDWSVVYVETPDHLKKAKDEQEIVAQNLRLAEMLGAQTETLTGSSAVKVIRDYVRRNHIHRVMVGRSSPRRWYNLAGASLAEQLLQEDPTMSVYVVGGDHTPQPYQLAPLWHWVSRLQILGSLALVAVSTILGLVLMPTVISRSANLVMIYLLAVVIASIAFGFLPALMTAVLSVLAYDFFFVPPFYQLAGFAPEYAITFLGLLLVSVITSTLVSRERLLTRATQRRADQVTQLYELSRDLAAAVDLMDVMGTVGKHITRTFGCDMVIFLPKDGRLALNASSAGAVLDASELPAAEWAFQQGRPAGHHTGTFSYASYRYFPLETSSGKIGVLGVHLAGMKQELHPEQMHQLGVYVTKAASAIERALLAEEASQAEILRATEKLQTALLNSISHDLRTPLASITGVLSSLRMDEDWLDPQTRRELVETAFDEAERLNRLVGNLLDMTRLEAGSIKLSLQPCDIQDVIGSALNSLSSRLGTRQVQVDLAPDLPLIALDFVLINQVIINLLDNAVKYSPEPEPIYIRALQHGDTFQVEIEDHGPGIPEEDLDHIFEKFYRVKRFENVVGTGLGLSICKGIIEVHGGKIWAENRSAGGVKMAFTLPFRSDPVATREPETEPLQPEGIQS